MQYCGLDLGKKSSHFCVVDAKRRVIETGTVRNQVHRLNAVFGELPPMRIVLEASTKAFWIADRLRDLGHTPIVVDPGRTKAIGAARIKHDKLDARVLAELCAADLLVEVDQPSESQRLARMPVVVRDGLIRCRTILINQVRSLLDSEGIELKKCATDAFVDRVADIWEEFPDEIARAIEPVLNSIHVLTSEIGSCGEQIADAISRDEDAKLLMTAPGVGPIVAACFLMAVRDPSRFESGRQVGAYLGLVPSLYQSGETYRRGRITKHGNKQARWALSVAANVLIGPRIKQHSAIRDWGLALAERIGRKKAVTAVARKLASVLWSMWRNGTTFEPRLAPAA
jgi:transposase